MKICKYFSIYLKKTILKEMFCFNFLNKNYLINMKRYNINIIKIQLLTLIYEKKIVILY